MDAREIALEKLQPKIGGMASSFCTRTLKNGVGPMDGPKPEIEVPAEGSRIRRRYER